MDHYVRSNHHFHFQWLSPFRDASLDPFVQGIMKSAVRIKPPKSKEPVTLDIIHEIAGYRDVGVALIAILMYSALLRISEAINLKWSHCSLQEGSLAIRVKRAKNDQQGRGRTTYIPFQGSIIRPLWEKWSTINSDSRYLFPSYNSGDRHMSRSSASRRIKNMLSNLGHPNLSSHSFRAGAATNEAARGVPILQLQRRGRWKSTRGMDPYIRDSLRAQGGHTEL